MMKQGQVLVLWRDGQCMTAMHQTDTMRRAKAWCRANGDAFDAIDFDDGADVEVMIVEVKAATRPHLKVVVDFGESVETEAAAVDGAAEGVG